MIKTERLVLRKIKMSDAKDMFEYAKKDTVGPNAGWEPHKSLSETKMILKMLIKEKESLAITIKGQGKMIGTIGLHVKQAKDVLLDIREVGYALDDTYWHQGYMTEAVSALMNYAFNKLNLRKLICGHEISNVRSMRVILKNNFKFTHIEKRLNYLGQEAQIMMYQITKEQYNEISNKI